MRVTLRERVTQKERERARHKTGAKQEQPYILCVPTGDESFFGDGKGDDDDNGKLLAAANGPSPL